MTPIKHEPAGAFAVAHRASSPTAPGAARRRSFSSRPAWREVLLLGVVYGLYTLARRISAGGANEAIANANRVLRAERVVELSPERWLIASFTNQFAAMPSLHVGWAIWCAWMVARLAQRAWVRRLAVTYPVVAVLVVLSTANHYLLDAAAGLLVLLTGWAISRPLGDKFSV